MKIKPIKAWAVILPGTKEPFTDLGLDQKSKDGVCRRFILPQTKSGAEAVLRINNVTKRHGYEIIPVLITPLKTNSK